MGVARFHDPLKTSNLTAYELCCGYVQQTEHPNEIRVQLWHEGAVYHVRSHDHANGKRLYWESFDTLAEARKAYRAQVRETR